MSSPCYSRFIRFYNLGIDCDISRVVEYARRLIKEDSKGDIMGGHKEGNVLIGGLVPPFYKAVTICTVSALKAKGIDADQLSLIWTGVSRIAEQLGIIDSDGKVTPKWKDAVELAEVQIREKHAENKGKPGRRKRKGSSK